ncbi:hypothetical protein ACFL34_05965, partial [Candidatus Sumerlaeota bacterium]
AFLRRDKGGRRVAELERPDKAFDWWPFAALPEFEQQRPGPAVAMQCCGGLLGGPLRAGSRPGDQFGQ